LGQRTIGYRPSLRNSEELNGGQEADSRVQVPRPGTGRIRDQCKGARCGSQKVIGMAAPAPPVSPLGPVTYLVVVASLPSTTSVMTPSRRLGLALVALVIAAPPATAQSLSRTDYACRFVQVPMRDGIRLNTSICRPKRAAGDLPFLLTRTPYGIAGDTAVTEHYRFLAADGYIFVGQDIIRQLWNQSSKY
jgi:hypothetical protein